MSILPVDGQQPVLAVTTNSKAFLPPAATVGLGGRHAVHSAAGFPGFLAAARFVV
jgi:hypothetical protein